MNIPRLIEELRNIRNAAYEITGCNPPPPPVDKTKEGWYMIGYHQAVIDILNLADKDKSIDGVLSGRI